MANKLPVSRLVRVSINLSPLAAATRTFGVLMIAGDSDVINGLERYRTYSDIDSIAADFGTTAPEYLAAQLYFSQSPKPKTAMIGRWIRQDSAALLMGGILSSSEQALSNFTSITSGGFQINIDGSVQSLTGLDFSGSSNLNGVASVIQAALGAGATCVWDGTEFEIKSGTTGAGVKASGTVTCNTNPSPGVQATGTIQLTGQPSPADTVTVDGTVITFVSGTPGAGQVQIGAMVADTLNNLVAYLQNSSNTNIALSTYVLLSDTITATARVHGTAGNSYTLTKSGSNITVSSGFSGGVAADTLTINGTAFTFVAASPTGNQILVAATADLTAANIASTLNASVVSGVALADYSVSGSVVTALYGVVGTVGNAFTLAKSSSHISVSGANLAGGLNGSSVGFATAPVSGTNISALLKLTSSLALAEVPGYYAETPVACAAILADLSAAWYGLMFAASVQPTDDQSVDVAGFIEALDITRIFGSSITDTSVLSSLVTTDLASRLKALNYRQSFCTFSYNPYAIASMFGRAFSVNFLANSSTITLMYKQEPGIIAEGLTTTQANVLQAKRCNVFAAYVNDTAIIQYGTMSGSAWFDEIHGLDWFQDAVQTACYNLLYTSTTKIPQTNSGVNQFINAISGVCDQAVANGLVAPGVWNSDGFGQLDRGQYLKTGYYIFAPSVDLQSQSDRDARVSPPIQVALKLAGAIQELDVLINVNR